jgi:hypothetical protein
VIIMKGHLLVVAATFCISPALLAQRATLAASSAAAVVPLANGTNAIDLLGDGTKAQVVVAWRGNYNGHGSSTAAFYLFAKSDRSDAKEWQIVPFFGGPDDGDKGSETFQTGEGADCILGDLRVIRHQHAPVEIVIASRELGESFADPAAVKFLYYRLARNTGEVPGWPPYYFQYSKTVPARRPYCDVNEAFSRELNLGTHGLGQAEGGR